MSERYSRLFSLPENLYSEGAPVVVAAGALLKDNQNGKILVQLKFKNISEKPIKAVRVKITQKDTIGKLLGEAIDYQYLDLNEKRDVEFGQKVPITLPDSTTREIEVSVTEVIFTDNTLWSMVELPWESLKKPETLSQALKDTELVKQYQIRYGKNCNYIYGERKKLWYCACGALNQSTEEMCHVCGIESAKLAGFNLAELEWEKNERLTAERRQAEEERIAEEERKERERVQKEQRLAEEKAETEVRNKKRMRTIMTAVAVASILLIAGSILFNIMNRSSAYNLWAFMKKNGVHEEQISFVSSDETFSGYSVELFNSNGVVHSLYVDEENSDAFWYRFYGEANGSVLEFLAHFSYEKDNGQITYTGLSEGPVNVNFMQKTYEANKLLYSGEIEAASYKKEQKIEVDQVQVYHLESVSKNWEQIAPPDDNIKNFANQSTTTFFSVMTKEIDEYMQDSMGDTIEDLGFANY